jgi:CRP-like cAMP-binding protein
MARYLVVADETVGGKPLLDEISSRNKAESSRFRVLVPAAVPKEGMTWTETEARGLAQDRLDRVLTQFQDLGVQGVGTVADADPYVAVQDALREEQFDEVILSAPSKRSGWMKPDLPGKIRSSLGIPVTFVAGERDELVRETALMRSPLFSMLPKRHVRALAKLSSVQGYRAGDSIVKEGSSDSDVYAILDGRVKVTRESHVLAHLSPGDVFGELSLLAPGPRTDAVVAEGPTRCLQLSGKDFRAATERDPALAASFFEAAGKRLRQLSRNFQDLVTSLNLEGEVLERFAEAAHVAYCAEELAKGMSWGEPNDEYLERHESLARYAGGKRNSARTGPTLVAYENLPEDVRQQNRDLMQDIPNKLAAAGYVLTPAGRGSESKGFTNEEIEALAEQEHERWVMLKLAQRWSFDKVRDDEARRHPDMVPWRELGPEERQRRYGMDGAARVGPGSLKDDVKEKDRANVRNMGAILNAAGYTIAKVKPQID